MMRKKSLSSKTGLEGRDCSSYKHSQITKKACKTAEGLFKMLSEI